MGGGDNKIIVIFNKKYACLMQRAILWFYDLHEIKCSIVCLDMCYNFQVL